ncbi:GH25 family lysozyme [Lactobacillus sp. ESL0679]|uniref:GH25 family lysozyme n=1 Tax=Lactobacillus sp. ESL0679 TaxID=2983209 RepID=UPI0023F90CC4|nr:GH25 family lysozyme [Lactobacillus sp. ESL0679]MDF7683652.1 GH25 family lysozyme [Lactobacillus sp. ESL0679]
MLNVIDVSNNNAGLDLTKIKADGVIAKVAEGTNFTDWTMPTFMRQADKAHILKGLYFFARPGDWKIQADFFLRIAKPYLSDVILVLDYESTVVNYGGVQWAKNWLDYVYSKTGTKPLIYMGLADENYYDWTTVAKKYSLWVAQYNDMNIHYGFKVRTLYGKVNHWHKMAIFQYTPNGRLTGYPGPLDLDTYYGKKSDWDNHKHNDTGSDEEMTWKVKVPITAYGGFLVTKQAGATLWDGPNNDKKLGMLGYGKPIVVTGYEKGFYKTSKGYIDPRTGVFKKNPLLDNPDIHSVIEVTGNAKGHAEADGPVTGRKFKKGDRYKAYKLRKNYLLIGAGKDKWINGEKVGLIL